MDKSISESPSFLYPSSPKGEWGYHGYKLLRVHGRCQLGTVTGYGRVWFVKSLAAECRDIEECRRGLIKEYEILLSLRGCPIAEALSLCEIEGAGLSIVMEYIDGLHLDKYLEKAPGRNRRAVMRGLVEAMASVHSRGVAHLDLKPENILIRGSYSHPEVCLIDFNLSDSRVFSYNKDVGGNAEYAAPEQFEEGYEADVRADVWSLGMILEKFNAGPFWKKAIRRALQKDPGKRPADASAMLPFIRRRRLMLKYGVIAVTAGAIIAAVFLFLPKPTESNVLTPPPPAQVITQIVHDTLYQSAPAIESEPDGGQTSEVFIAQKYATQLKEYDRAIAKAKMELKISISDSMPNWKGDPLKSAIQRRADFATFAIRRLQEISSELMDVRQTFPEELLASHSIEWCTQGDAQLRELIKEYQETIQKIDVGLVKDVEEEKARKEEERGKDKEDKTH